MAPNSFVDEVTLVAIGGNGGHGRLSFARAKNRAKGGPDGGDGGNGGNVVIIARENVRSLFEITKKQQYRAEHAQAGGPHRKRGASGATHYIEVPLGTIVKEQNGGALLADLNEEGKTCIVARGGTGGFGNLHFASATNQVPTEITKGTTGETREIHLEVKLIADIGLVGFPNAGKSTLLSTVTNATPKTAPYPFTTLHPHLGMAEIAPGQTLLLADIPGLIEGASNGRGMGTGFLKHIERTSLLAHLIDLTAYESDEIIRQYHIINNELTNFSTTLSKKPQLVVLTKAECVEPGFAQECCERIIQETGRSCVVISAVARQGISELFTALDRLKREHER
jgi:GTP-binding protein